MESFKQILDYPDYWISEFGRVLTRSRKVRFTHAKTGKEHYRTTKERFLKVYENNRTGYKFVQLYKNKKSKNKNIHRLVAEAFIKNYQNHPVINHRDGNKHNNIVNNLQWCTNEYNHEHATKTGLVAKGEKIGTSKLNKACIIAIRKLISSGWKDSEIAGLFDVSRSNITLIRLGNTWKHISH